MENYQIGDNVVVIIENSFLYGTHGIIEEVIDSNSMFVIKTENDKYIILSVEYITLLGNFES